MFRETTPCNWQEERIDVCMPDPQMTVTLWHTCGNQVTVTGTPEAVIIDGREYARFKTYFSCCKENNVMTVGPMDWPLVDSGNGDSV